MARIRFIIDPVNPQIGERWPYEEAEIRRLIKDYEIHMVRGRSHAQALARKACHEKTDLLVCIGGDQAMNEIANALYLEKSAHKPRLTIHGGLHTGDFSRSLLFRTQFIDFLNDYLNGKALKEELDLGLIRYTGEYGQRIEQVFVNYVAFGFASFVMSQIKSPITTLKALRLILRSLAFYKAPSVRIQWDQAPAQTRPLLTGFINNMPYASKGLKVAPEANPQDELLRITLVKKASKWKTLRVLFRHFVGTQTQDPLVERNIARAIKIESTMVGRTVRIDFDGESRGYLPAEVRIQKKVLQILR